MGWAERNMGRCAGGKSEQRYQTMLLGKEAPTSVTSTTSWGLLVEIGGISHSLRLSGTRPCRVQGRSVMRSGDKAFGKLEGGEVGGTEGGRAWALDGSPEFWKQRDEKKILRPCVVGYDRVVEGSEGEGRLPLPPSLRRWVFP